MAQQNWVQTQKGVVNLNYSDLSGTIAAAAFAGTASSGYVLQIVSGTPTWSSVSATNATNLSSGAAGEIPYQTAASTTGFTAAGTSGQILVSAGTSAPTWNSAITVQQALQNGSTLSSGTTTINWASGDVIEFTMGSSSATFAFSNTPASGNVQTITIILNQPATGSTYTMPAFSSTIRWDSGITPVLTATLGKTDIIQIMAVNVSGTTTYFGSQVFGNG